MNCKLCNIDNVYRIVDVCKDCYDKHYMKVVSIDYSNGDQDLTYTIVFEGVTYNKEQFDRLVKLKAFL